MPTALEQLSRVEAEVAVLRVLLEDTPAPPAPPEIVPLSQRDPRWASLRLGASTMTVGGSGCAMVCACMEASLVRPGLTPDVLGAWLNAHGGYTPPPNAGLLYWSKVSEFVPGLEFVSYHKWTTAPADMRLVRAELAAGPAILQVDFRPGGALDTHFVLALREHNGDIEMLDPWTGTCGWLLQTYGAAGWDLPRAIYALVRYAVVA